MCQDIHDDIMPIKKHNCAWPSGEKIDDHPDTPYLNLISLSRISVANAELKQ